jgi:nucleotide-binding universal stress UspA family protein
MPLFHCILVGADFSEQSKEAFRVACSLAHETKTRVYIVHVMEESQDSEAPLGSLASRVPIAFTEPPAREAYWEGLLRDSYVPECPIDVRHMVLEGIAAKEILMTAGAIGSDLIVMGTHGRTGLRRLVAGSVAETVLRQARCPVLALSSPRTSRETVGVRVILCPTDFSERSEAGVKVARALARDQGARLILLHVLPVEVVLYGTVPAPLDLPEIRDSLQSMGELIDGPDLKYPVETRLTQGDAAAQILQVAEEVGAGIIVMGTHGRTGLGRMLLGSVAESVLRRARCPVLTVKSESATASEAPPATAPATSTSGVEER